MLLAWVVVLFLRRLLPESRRSRGRWGSYALGVAPLLHLLASGFALAGLESASVLLHLCNLALVTTAVANVAGMVVFDIALARTRFAIPDLVRDLTQLALIALITISVLHSAGINPLSLAVTSTVATAAVGLAMQSTLANIGAGVLLQFDGSLKQGDWIQFGARVGRVETFYWRATALRTTTGDLALVPHTQIIGAEIVNLSRPQRAHQITLKLSFHHRHPPDQIAEAVTATLREIPGVLPSPAPTCEASEFAGSTILYTARCWLDDIEQEAAISGEARTRLWYVSRRKGLEGPAPAPESFSSEQIDEIRRTLSRSSLFSSLDKERQESLIRVLRPMLFGAGERILREGDAGSSMFLIIHGEVEVEREDVGEPLRFGPADSFGEISLLTGAPRTATCRAATRCFCCELEGDAFRALLAGDPSLADTLARVVEARQQEREEARDRAPRSRSASSGETALLRKVREYFRL